MSSPPADDQIIQQFSIHSEEEQEEWISTGRKEDCVVERPLVYGTEARILSKPDGEFLNTHSWSVYVRGAFKEDISCFVKKVIFYLHPSFEQPERILEHPPFVVTESGWGEFDIKIVIVFQDPTEKPVVLNHTLKLYLPDGTLPMKGKPVISEQLDLIVFTNPTCKLYDILESNPLPDDRKYLVTQYDSNDSQEIKTIQNASAQIKKEIGRLKELYDEKCQEMLDLFIEINQVNSDMKL